MTRFLASMLLVCASAFSYATALTDRDIDLALASAHDITNWWSQHAAQLDAVYDESLSRNASFEEMIDEPLLLAKRAKIYDEFSKKVKQHGFKNVEHWRRVSLSILVGLMDDIPGDANELNNMLKDVEGSQLSAIEKEEYLFNIRLALSALELQNKMSAADKSVIERNKARLKKMMNEEINP